jgi:pimeloyl-ACP methyl ester carboxylesterase
MSMPQRSKTTPPLQHALALIPNARLEIIPDCGHLAPLDAPHAATQP